MAGKHMDIEALDKLIRAVQDYQEELEVNKKILKNAADVCDCAMGSDDIVKKHIKRLNEAVDELTKTSRLAADVAEALIEDKKRAIDVLDD